MEKEIQINLDNLEEKKKKIESTIKDFNEELLQLKDDKITAELQKFFLERKDHWTLRDWKDYSCEFDFEFNKEEDDEFLGKISLSDRYREGNSFEVEFEYEGDTVTVTSYDFFTVWTMKCTPESFIKYALKLGFLEDLKKRLKDDIDYYETAITKTKKRLKYTLSLMKLIKNDKENSDLRRVKVS